MSSSRIGRAGVYTTTVGRQTAGVSFDELWCIAEARIFTRSCGIDHRRWAAAHLLWSIPQLLVNIRASAMHHSSSKLTPAVCLPTVVVYTPARPIRELDI